MHDLTVASFFSGIGLLDLGLEWAGWRTVSFSEIVPFACRVLDSRFPGVPNLGDITRIEHVPDALMWAGGFPCQPVSNAGKRLGNADERWLWPTWLRLIRRFRPPILYLENVAALTNRGLDELEGDLAASGYDTEWDCIPAEAVGAPHERDRIWIVAYAREWYGRPGGPGGSEHGGEGLRVEAHQMADTDEGQRRTSGQGEAQAEPAGLPLGSGQSDATPAAMAHARRERGEPRGDTGDVVCSSRDAAGETSQRERSWGAAGDSSAGGTGLPELADTDSQHGDRASSCSWTPGRTEPTNSSPLSNPVFAGLEGHERGVMALANYRRSNADPAGSGWWATEPGLGRVAHGVPHRVDRLRALGNAVVPQVAEFIGWRIREAIEAMRADA